MTEKNLNVYAFENARHSVRTAIVCDDQEDVCKVAVSQLCRNGILAEGVTSKAALAEVLEKQHPDLLVLDLALGETDAVEIFGLLREVRFGGITVLMSGYGDAVLNHALRIGVRAGIRIAGTLRKPFRARDLRELVAQANQSSSRPKFSRTAATEEGLLRKALTHGWIEFWYQPKVHLATNSVTGVEGLARIRHPEKGVIGPAAFLPGAPDDEMHALTIEAVKAASRVSTRLSEIGHPLQLSVNVAGNTLRCSSLLDQIKSIWRPEGGNRPLMLEITETDLIEDTFAAEEFATRAVLHGFDISIDDFGTGYATFDRLRNFPFSELKLERSVVAGCAHDNSLLNICRAGVQLAHGFEATVVAEGVELSEDLEVLRELGFDKVQGYYYSPPLPVRDLEEYLTKARIPSVGRASSQAMSTELLQTVRLMANG